MIAFSPMNPAVTRFASPMRIWRAWLSRERAVPGAAFLALDVAERQVAREERLVSHAAEEAVVIEARVSLVENVVRDSLADASSPGVIDAREVRQLRLALFGVRFSTHEHVKSLEDLK